jgi:N-acyl-D-amino-acid deacylase
VGIEGDTIAYIGNDEPDASQIIDASQQIVAPGFIDIHTHEDTWLLHDARGKEKLSDGVTTLVVGNCGFSAAPLLPGREKLVRENFLNFVDVPWDWSSVAEYLQRVGASGLGVNVGTLVGHNAIRLNVMGLEKRAPTTDELEKMKSLVDGAMTDGAFGLSTGLIYVPGIYSETTELVELSRVVARHGGLYASHIRGEASTLKTAVREALEIGRRAGIPIEISHHKASGRANWGMVNETLATIETARDEGVDVNCDVYPYTAGNTGIGTLVPSWVFSDGWAKAEERLTDPEIRTKISADMVTQTNEERPLVDIGPENIYISYSRDNSIEGKSLADIAKKQNSTPAEVVLNIVQQERSLHSTLIILFEMSEQDVDTVIRHPLSMIASDSVNPTGKPHPRVFGTFSRVLAKYVRDRHLLTLEEAVQKMTSMPAHKMGMFDRGIIESGKKADIVVFDPSQVQDKATFDNPARLSEGINYVFVNGRKAWEHNEQTPSRAGTVLRHRRKQP